jgi:hypothetical protein
MRHNNGQWRDDRRSGRVVGPERRDRRRSRIRDGSQQQHNSGNVSSVFFHESISLFDIGLIPTEAF